MHLTRWFFLIPFLFATQAFAGTPAEAAKIRQNWKANSENWELQIKAAGSDVNAQREAWAKRPDLRAAFMNMWTCIRPSLAEDWTLEYDAWLLRAYPNVTDGPKPTLTECVATIRRSIEQQHLKSPLLSPVCIALVVSQDPSAYALLQKIETQNPDPKVQGVAALGEAMLLKGLGDEGDQMAKRLTLIKKAIINSADVQINGVAISDMASDELYVISNLTKGRVAPDLVGTNSGGQPMKLSDFNGKTVVLLFWSSTVPDLDHLLEVTSAMEKKYAGKPVAILGVNHDPTDVLRSLQKKETNPLTWPNFSDPSNKLATVFRVSSFPLACVLDGKRTLQYIGAPGSFVELTVDALLAAPSAPTPAPAPTGR